MEYPTTSDSGKKNGNFNFPPKNEGSENELSAKSSGGGDGGGKASGFAVTTSSASAGEK